MTAELSYPGLQCVLEHLEAARRIHIVSRSPALQQTDKPVPLNLQKLVVSRHTVELNDLEADFYSSNKIEFKTGVKREESVQFDMPQEQAMKKLIECYLTGRSAVNVHQIEFQSQPYTPILPENLDLTINKLSSTVCGFEDYLPFINQKSFPLKELVTRISRPDIVNHPVFCSSENLTVFVVPRDGRSTMNIHKIQNKKVSFQYLSTDMADPVKLINYWLQNGKTIGTEFSYIWCFENDISTLFGKLEKEFDEFHNELEGIDEQFIPDEPRYSIPINSESKVLVYGIETEGEGEDEETVKQVVMKVVSTTAEEN